MLNEAIDLDSIRAFPDRDRPSGLPSQREELLLKAALWTGPPAARAWDEWNRLADLHHDLTPGETRVLPLVYGNLSVVDSSAASRMDPRVEGMYKRTFYYNSLVLRNLARAKEILDRAGIRFIVLKGAALILAGVYAKAADRVLADFDLLVPFADRSRALDVLAGSGYAPIDRWDWYREPFRQVHSIQLKSRADGSIDLHWFPLAAFKHERANSIFFDHAQAISADCGEMHVTAPELQLIQALAHGLQHDPAGRTQWVCDAFKLVGRRPGMDWDKVARLAETLRVGPFIQLGVDHLAGSFGAAITQTGRAAVGRIRPSAEESRVFAALNKRRPGMRDLLFLKQYDLKQDCPDRPVVYYWWTLFRYWLHAARVSSGGAVFKEFLAAAPRLLANKPYDMGEYRNSE